MERPGECVNSASGYGESVSARYDELYPDKLVGTERTVDFIQNLVREAPSASVLEFGVGTGRIALPIARSGVRCVGVDISTSMLEALRHRDSTSLVGCIEGDSATVDVDGQFGVVACLFNGIFDPRGLKSQVSIFRNAARHLVRGGFFLVDSFILPASHQDSHWHVVPRFVNEDGAELQLVRVDPVSRVIDRKVVRLSQDRCEEVADVRDCYLEPREIDILALSNGFNLHSRYSDWSMSDYTAYSNHHVSVYVKA